MAKTTSLPLLATAASDDLVAIIDVSETNEALRNKRVTIGSLVAGSGGAGFTVPDPTGVAATDTANVQATIALAVANGGGRVIFGPGSYSLSHNAVHLTSDEVVVVGSDLGRTNLYFVPTANGQVMIHFDGSGASVWRSGLWNIWYGSTDTTYVKTAIKLTDVRYFNLSGIKCDDNGWHDTTGASIGLHLRGREYMDTPEVCQFRADQPILIDVNPALSTNSFDFSFLHGIQCVVSSGVSNYNIKVVDGVMMTSSRIEDIDCALGIGAFYWTDTTGISSSYHFRLCNVRMEQGIAGTSYSFDVGANGSMEMQGFEFIDCIPDPTQNGIRLNGRVLWAHVHGFRHTQAGGTALSVNYGVSLLLTNFFYQTGSALVGLSSSTYVALNLLNGYTVTTFQTSGNLDLAIVTTHNVSLRNSLDVAQYVDIWPGLTADQVGAITLRDRTGALKWTLGKGGDNNFYLVDSVGINRFLIYNGANTNTDLTADGSGAVRFNTGGGGTGGVEFYDGAGSPTLVASMANNGRLTNRRVIGNGTAHVAGDYALSAGWGNTATVSAVAAKDSGGRVSITCNGAGIAADPTVTLTFKDGTWTTAPAIVAGRGDVVAPNGLFVHTTPSATAPVFTFKATPVAGSVYILDFVVVGK